jgi:hypothetical protein
VARLLRQSPAKSRPRAARRPAHHLLAGNTRQLVLPKTRSVVVFHAYLLTIFSKNRMGETLREGIRVLSGTLM